MLTLLIESNEKYGILNPLIVRPLPEGVYEIVSGHRRKHAAEKLGHRRMHAAKRLGFDTIRAVVKEMTDDEE